MVAYRRIDETSSERPRRTALSHELFHGLSPEEFDKEARSLADAEAMTPSVRARLKAQLVERLKTPIDQPSWGPDWVKHGDKYAPTHGNDEKRGLARLFSRDDGEDEDETENGRPSALSERDQDDAHSIARNMEKSRQVFHYRRLYAAAAVLAIVIALLAMFVDYQIIRGDIWTRALSNEFMVVPQSLQSTLVFKSMQVIFAVLIVHFMLKITGVYGRNVLVTTAFLFALVMIGCLGYLVAYNNMSGGTSTTLEHQQATDPSQNNSIDQLFASVQKTPPGEQFNQPAEPAQVMTASMTPSPHEFSLPLPRLSQRSLADTDSWVWLAFASVIFFIVTTVAALYMQTVENNIRNFLISRDYKHRQRQFAQLHLLELADREQPRTA